jgi:hypothetical protein
MKTKELDLLLLIPCPHKVMHPKQPLAREGGLPSRSSAAALVCFETSIEAACAGISWETASH